jgi:hypothetical protein
MFLINDSWSANGLNFDGIDSNSSSLIILNSEFKENGLGRSEGTVMGGYGGAIEIRRAHAYLEGNLIHHNYAVNDYGAMYVTSSELHMARNVISANEGGHISGLFISPSHPFTMTNNIIVDNVSLYSLDKNPAVRLGSGTGLLLHNTIARNDSTYGIEIGSSATVTLTNTILVSHTVGITVTSGGSASLDGTLWGNGDWANGTDWGGDGTIVTGTVNFWSAPVFTNPDSGNYHIASGSAAVDAGMDAGIYVDIDGQPRPWPTGGGFDIGADEFQIWNIFQPLLLKNTD